MKYTVFYLICVFSLSTVFVAAQSAKQQLAVANAGKLASQHFYSEITFTDKSGYFIIPVKIDTITYDYIFDTGGYNTVTGKIMESAKLSPVMEVEVGSSNKIKSKIKLAKVPTLQIGEARFEGVGVFNFDFTASPTINCYTNGGLIGKSVIREAVWQIDYQKSVIRISDKLANMPFVDKGERIQVELDKTLTPFLKLMVNGKEKKFMLDFGYGGLLSLTEQSASTLKVKQTITIDGEGNIGANGVVHETSYITLLENLMIGKTEFKHPVAYYSKSNNYNLLGTELAKYFIITLDFRNETLILTPYNDTTQRFETFGFSVNMDTNHVYISKIFNGLSAYQAGLLVNDVLIGINGKQLSSLSTCAGYFYINKLLDSEKEITIQIRRGELLKEVRLVKQSPFSEAE